MAGESGYLLEARVLPDDDGIVRVAMCANQLVGALTEHQVAYLGPCVYRLQLHTRLGVPELYASICCSTSRHEKSTLVGAPCKRLYSCFVGSEPEERFVWTRMVLVRPHHKFIIVST